MVDFFPCVFKLPSSICYFTMTYVISLVFSRGREFDPGVVPYFRGDLP